MAGQYVIKLLFFVFKNLNLLVCLTGNWIFLFVSTCILWNIELFLLGLPGFVGCTYIFLLSFAVLFSLLFDSHF